MPPQSRKASESHPESQSSLGETRARRTSLPLSRTLVKQEGHVRPEPASQDLVEDELLEYEEDLLDFMMMCLSMADSVDGDF